MHVRLLSILYFLFYLYLWHRILPCNIFLPCFAVLQEAATGQPGGPEERPWTSTASSPVREAPVWATTPCLVPLSPRSPKTSFPWRAPLPPHSRGCKRRKGGRLESWRRGLGWSDSPGLWAAGAQWAPLPLHLWEGWSTSHVWSRGWKVATRAARGTAAAPIGRRLTNNNYCLFLFVLSFIVFPSLGFSVTFNLTSSAWNTSVKINKMKMSNNP